MTVVRGVYLLMLFAALAICVIGLRVEGRRCAMRIEQLSRQRVSVEKSIWALHMEIGRLKRPDAVVERLALWFPKDDEGGQGGDVNSPLYAMGSR